MRGHEILCQRSGGLVQPLQDKPGGFLFCRLTIVAFAFGQNFCAPNTHAHRHPKSRLVRRSPSFQEPVRRQPAEAGLSQDLQGGFWIHGRQLLRGTGLRDHPVSQRLDRFEASVFDHSADHRFEHLGEHALCRYRSGRSIGRGKTDLPGEARKPGRTAPEGAQAREVPGGGVWPSLTRGYRDRIIPRRVPQELEPLAVRGRLGGQGEIPRAKGTDEERRILKPVR